MTLPIIVIAFLTLTFIADLYTTKRAVVDNPTEFREANPLMALAMKPFGIWGLVVVKLAVLGFICWAVWTWRTWAVYGPVIAVGALTGYVAWRNKCLIQSRK